jgi:hypothetical protein
MSGAYEIPATRIEIRDMPVAEFGKFLKLFQICRHILSGLKITVLTRSTINCIQNAASKPGKMSGAYESPALVLKYEIRRWTSLVIF